MKVEKILKSLREKTITDLKAVLTKRFSQMMQFKILGEHFDMAKEISDEELLGMFDANRIIESLVINPRNLEKNFRESGRVERKKKRIVF